jgi:upstream activation factor subunit UAF30
MPASSTALVSWLAACYHRLLMPPIKRHRASPATAKKISKSVRPTLDDSASVKKVFRSLGYEVSESKGGQIVIRDAAAMKPDEALAGVVGPHPLPRSEVTKKIWEYVRKHNLQDPKDKRTIRADNKLRPVFGGRSSVSMFEMTKLVNSHLKEAK